MIKLAIILHCRANHDATLMVDDREAYGEGLARPLASENAQISFCSLSLFLYLFLSFPNFIALKSLAGLCEPNNS